MSFGEIVRAILLFVGIFAVPLVALKVAFNSGGVIEVVVVFVVGYYVLDILVKER
jgi:hypothetical protein